MPFNLTLGRMVALVLIVLSALAAIIIIPQMFESNDARDIMVIQSPSTGALAVYTDAGWKWQGMGKVTTYPRRDQFSFSARKGPDGKVTAPDETIQTRFNDGGHGGISGTISWAMPLAEDKIIRLHKDYGSMQAIEQQLMRTVMQKVIYNVGPTMSSTESSAEKRPVIPQYIDDQLANGPYLTKTVQETQKDPITGQDKVVNIVAIATGPNGKPLRESHSPLTDYGIQLQPVSINEIFYDKIVEDQIAQRQSATTQVQIAIANARRAEQDAITTARQGEANAAKAKWEQEVVNAKTIADAQARVTIAAAGVQEADAFKKSEILRGEGEATRKRLVMEADGQLDKRLETVKTINLAYADALAKAQPGAWTPTVVMGAGAGGQQSGMALVELLTAKVAKETGVDLGVMRGQSAKKPQP